LIAKNRDINHLLYFLLFTLPQSRTANPVLCFVVSGSAVAAAAADNDELMILMLLMYC